MKTKFYYVVFIGRKPGIYTSWTEADKQVNKFPFCLYRKYATLEQAELHFKGYDLYGIFLDDSNFDVGNYPPRIKKGEPSHLRKWESDNLEDKNNDISKKEDYNENYINLEATDEDDLPF